MSATSPPPQAEWPALGLGQMVRVRRQSELWDEWRGIDLWVVGAAIEESGKVRILVTDRWPQQYGSVWFYASEIAEVAHTKDRRAIAPA